MNTYRQYPHSKGYGHGWLRIAGLRVRFVGGVGCFGKIQGTGEVKPPCIQTGDECKEFNASINW